MGGIGEIAAGLELFAASESSQPLFEMQGMDEESMAAFNGAMTEGDRLPWLECIDIVAREEIRPAFIGCKTECLRDNLFFIHESMADVLAWVYRQQLLVDKETTILAQLCHQIVIEDPLGYGMSGLSEKEIEGFLIAECFTDAAEERAAFEAFVAGKAAEKRVAAIEAHLAGLEVEAREGYLDGDGARHRPSEEELAAVVEAERVSFGDALARKDEEVMAKVMDAYDQLHGGGGAGWAAYPSDASVGS